MVYITRINFEVITQFERIHILYVKLACKNPLDGFSTLATNGLKPRNFSLSLLLVSQELFTNTYKKRSGIDIFSIFRNFVAKYLFKYSWNMVNIR